MPAQIPKVSIITPFRNSENYLAECLKSVISQNHQDWELLLVNDRSTDRSVDVVRNFMSREPRIALLGNKGIGIIDALRTGYSASTGTYVTRMDSDDIMCDSRLSTMVNQLEQSGPGYVATGLVRYFGDSQISQGYKQYELWMNSLTKSGQNFDDIYKECPIPSPCWMVSREDFDKCGGFDSNSYPEDYDLTFRFYREGLKVIPSNSLLHYWRDYPARTSRMSENYALERFVALKTDYFLEIDHDAEKELCILGAGSKGKQIAQVFIDKKVDFHWVTAHPRKMGSTIYGIDMIDWNTYRSLNKSQSIVTFSDSIQQRKLVDTLSAEGGLKNQDYFLFC